MKVRQNTKRLSKREMRQMLETLRKVHQFAQMQTAHFRTDAQTVMIREATAEWRQTWLIRPLNDVINALAQILNDFPQADSPQSGVVPMRCDVCDQVFGVINASAYQADKAQNEAHYFCKACLALPEAEVEARLAGKSLISA